MALDTPDGNPRIPTTHVLCALIACAVALGFAETTPAAPFAFIEFSLVLMVLAGLAYLLQIRWPAQARWAIALGLIVILPWAEARLNAPHLLTLLPVVVALATELVGIRGAIALVLATTGWLVVARGVAVSDGGIVGTALMGAWAMVALITAVYLPTREALAGARAHADQALGLIDRARARQAELAQALDALAHLNRQLVLTTQKLDEARQAAEAAQKLKADFVARVSHELRTPLNMIIGFAEIIMEAPNAYGSDIPQSLLADLAIILRNSRHLSDLIDDVLDLSRIDAGQMAITRERTSIRAIIEAAMDIVRPLFESKGLFLRASTPQRLPQVYCDPTRIRETVVNLLSNAGRFTEQGGVEIAAYCDGPDVIIAVTDTGPGIDPQQGKRLFQPFQQLEDALRRRHGGTGLGLAISKSFVELHGGRMWFDSKLGRGTTFCFRLPIDPPKPVDSTVMRWLQPTWEYRQRLTRPFLPEADMHLRLVVLEEGTGLMRLLGRYLSHVETARVDSLEQARAELARAPAHALLLNAPAVGEALDRVVNSTLGPWDTPVIVCAVPELQQTTGKLGVHDYLLKPVSREELCAALDRLALTGKTILVVDDEPQELRMFWRMLISAGRGYHVLTAGDGEEALALMRTQHCDAVLLDLVMPKMDGFQLLQARSSDPALQAIPIVVITALDPSAQPIVSSSVAVTHGAGLSVPQLLNCVEGLSRLFAATRSSGQGPSATSRV